MFIEKLEKDKKHLTRLTLPNGDEFLIDNDVCAENRLSKGAETDEEIIRQLIEESDYKRAKSRALWLLDRQDYTEKALYEKLIRAGFKKSSSARVLAKLCELGLVDDRRYAERFAERCAQSNISKREAVHKMLLKGISLDLAKEVTEETGGDPKEQIRALIEKKYLNKLRDDNGYQKVFADLARKGFSFDDIKTVIKSYNTELEFSEE